jgi:hypothetical protein
LAGIFHANAPKVDLARLSAAPATGGAPHRVGAKVARGANSAVGREKLVLGAQKPPARKDKLLKINELGPIWCTDRQRNSSGIWKTT